MITHANAAISVKATTVQGSVDLVKRCHARGDAFVRFNDGFVKVYPKRPPIALVSVHNLMNEIFASGAPEYNSPFLVNVEFFDAGMAELGLDASQQLKAKLPA